MAATKTGRMSGAGGRNAASAPTGGGIGSQGTLGGLRMGFGGGGRKAQGIDNIYLWILVLIEIGLIGSFRHIFRRRHGG